MEIALAGKGQHHEHGSERGQVSSLLSLRPWIRCQSQIYEVKGKRRLIWKDQQQQFPLVVPLCRGASRCALPQPSFVLSNCATPSIQQWYRLTCTSLWWDWICSCNPLAVRAPPLTRSASVCLSAVTSAAEHCTNSGTLSSACVVSTKGWWQLLLFSILNEGKSIFSFRWFF